MRRWQFLYVCLLRKYHLSNGMKECLTALERVYVGSANLDLHSRVKGLSRGSLEFSTERISMESGDVTKRAVKAGIAESQSSQGARNSSERESSGNGQLPTLHF